MINGQLIFFNDRLNKILTDFGKADYAEVQKFHLQLIIKLLIIKYINNLLNNMINESISVDCSVTGGNPGKGEYRGVDTGTGEVLFEFKFPTKVSNNVAEFLAIVEGINYLKSNNLNSKIIYEKVIQKHCLRIRIYFKQEWY